MGTDIEAVVYLMLQNAMLHDLFPSVITVGVDVSGLPTFCRHHPPPPPPPPLPRDPVPCSSACYRRGPPPHPPPPAEALPPRFLFPEWTG